MSISGIETIEPGRRAGAAKAGVMTSGSQARPVAVLIVDDGRDSSYALWALLRWQPGIRICATAALSGALSAAQRERPALCLVPAALGPGGIHQIAQLADAPRVLAYTDRRDPSLEAMALVAGADGVLWRYVDGDELADTIRRVAAQRGRPMDLTQDAIGRMIECLDDRDRPMASMLLLGTSLDEIARVLGVSATAVRARRAMIVKRLEAGPRRSR